MRQRVARMPLVLVFGVVSLLAMTAVAVVAEGVEDQAAWDTLADLSCDHVQGYFLSRPLPGADVLAWLEAYDPSRPAAGSLTAP